MKLYLITQTEETCCAFTSAVVCANSEEEAKAIHPSARNRITTDEDWEFGDWASSPDHVAVSEIGTAIEGTLCGFAICASFQDY